MPVPAVLVVRSNEATKLPNQVVQQTELFSQLSDENLFATASHMSRVKYRKGECIIKQVDQTIQVSEITTASCLGPSYA
jgi:hypothetical protein